MSQEINRRTKTPEQALSALMRLCSKAERSSGDARRLMRRWGVDTADAERVLDKLCQMRFIDDNRYAEAYVHDKVKFAGWGVYKIRAGLAAKGVDRQIIAQAIDQIERTGSNERLRTLLKNKLKNLKVNTAFETKNKLLRYGMSRGFEYEAVYDIVNELLREYESED